MRFPLRAVLAWSIFGTLAACADSHRGRCVSARCRAAPDAAEATQAEPSTEEDDAGAEPELDTVTPAMGNEGDASSTTPPNSDTNPRLRATFAPIGPARGWFAGIAATPSTVLVATGTSVQRSRDEGVSWTLVDAPDLYNVSALAVLGTDFFAASPRGVYRSTDNAATWSQVPLPRSPVAEGAPANNLAVQGADVFLTRSGAAYRLNAATGAFELLPIAPGPGGLNSLGLNGSLLYTAKSYNGGVYQLDFSGQAPAWTRIPELGIAEHLAFAFIGSVGLAAGSSLHRSDANVWTELSARLEGPTDLLADRGTFYAATRAGLFSSTDSGSTWTSLISAAFSSGSALASDGKNLYAAPSDGIWRRRAEGGWQTLSFVADEVWTLVAGSDEVLVISASGPLHGANGNWERVPGTPLGKLSDFGPPTRGAFASSIISHDGEFIANSGNQVIASSDGGRTFVPRSDINTQFLVSTSLGIIALQRRPERLVLSKDGGRSWEPLVATKRDADVESALAWGGQLAEVYGVLITTDSNGGTYRSADQGNTWTKLALPSAIGSLHGLVTVGDVTLGWDQGKRLVRSTDKAQTWTRAGLDELQVSSLIVWRDIVFASVGSQYSGQGGVYGSTDQGVTWQRLDPSFKLRVSSLAVLDDTLYAGTLDASIWAARLME